MNKREIEVGNRRLLKLAEYLEALPPGQYDQREVRRGGPKCAGAHTSDMPQFKRYSQAMLRQDALPRWSDFYRLDGGSGWNDIFAFDGCRQPNGQPALTAKQAASFIRRFVSERRASK